MADLEKNHNFNLFSVVEIRKELSLEDNRTAFQGNRKADQWSDSKATGISLISFQDLRWVSTSFLHSRAYQYSTAKVYVFSDSVLCLGQMGDDLVESWKKQIQ